MRKQEGGNLISKNHWRKGRSVDNDIAELGDELGFTVNQTKLLQSYKNKSKGAYSNSIKKSLQQMVDGEIVINGQKFKVSDVMASKMIESVINNGDVGAFDKITKITGDSKEVLEVTHNNLQSIITQISGDKDM